MSTTGMNGEPINEEQHQQLLMMMLIQQHQQIAMMSMGKIMNPSSEKTSVDLSQAKYAIDTLNALEKYTKGNMSPELERYMKETLTNLRLNFVDEKKKAATTATPDEKTKTDE
jgi:beta-glucosidase/6-phospho-beta-glucosidase/beta-galactosidase